MSGYHAIHIKVDASSPRYGTGHYRFEQHYQFSLPEEQDVQHALAAIAELCEQLRTPVRDTPPDRSATDAMQQKVNTFMGEFADHLAQQDGGPAGYPDRAQVEGALDRIGDALAEVDQQLGGPPLGDENT